MPRFINPVPQYLNSAGDPIVSGEMYFYEIGSTTPKDTYLDAELTIPATNPVLLNADGRLPDTYLLGSYRTVLSEPSTGQIWERDNVGSEFSEGFGEVWNSTVTYNIPDVVLFNGAYYVSQTNNNLDNQPSPSSSNWDVYYLGAKGPNLLDNSNFQIHQRGTGAVDTGGYYVDRWTTLAKSTVGGAVSTVQPRQFGGSDPRWYLRMVNQGATNSLAYLQQAVRPERMVLGRDYTVTVSLSTLNANGNDGKILVYGVVSGAYTLIHEETLTLTSNTDISTTFNYTHSLDLSADDSFVAVRFQLSADTPVVNGGMNIKSIKLEEGDVFTGYEPTPYAIDESECHKWFWRLKADDQVSPITVLKQVSPSTLFGSIPLPETMYSVHFTSNSGASDFRLVDQNAGLLTNITGYSNRSSSIGSVQVTASGLGTDSTSLLTFNSSSGFIDFSCEI